MIDWYSYTMQAVPWYMETCLWLVGVIVVTGAISFVVSDLRSK